MPESGTNVWMQSEHWYSPKRIAVAIVIAAGIYAIALGIGTLLFATGTIATGATHNDCPNYREDIAREQGIDEEDVPDEQVKNATIACLEEHELTEEEAYRSEYLFWSVWPGVICAVIFLLWPVWTRILLNQEAAEEHEGGGEHRQPHQA